MDGGVVPYGNAVAFPLVLLVGVTVGALDAGSGARRRGAVLLSLASFLPPFLVEPEHSALRLLCAMATVMVVLRAIDLATDARDWPWWRRLWLMVSIWDSRRAELGEPGIDRLAWLQTFGFGALALALGLAVALADRIATMPAVMAIRWLAGAGFIYVTFEAMQALLVAGHRLFGVGVPRFHHHPLLARSLSELWGARWNMIIHEPLARLLFRPLARRRRPWLGVVASFSASALLHFWLMAAAVGLRAGVSMGAFFLVQGALMALERAAGQRLWRVELRRAWTILAVVLPSPLFTEPLLVTLGLA